MSGDAPKAGVAPERFFEVVTGLGAAVGLDGLAGEVAAVRHVLDGDRFRGLVHGDRCPDTAGCWPGGASTSATSGTWRWPRPSPAFAPEGGATLDIPDGWRARTRPAARVVSGPAPPRGRPA